LDSSNHTSDTQHRDFKNEINLNRKNNILIILGAAESGVGAALLGKQQGWDVFVSDNGKIREDFKDTLLNANIAFEEEGHTEEKILSAACVVKSPGIPDKVAIVKKIREAGIEVCSEIEFGFRYKGDSKIIAITGSNGKSTTTTLTYEILKNAGFSVSLVGNIGYSFARQIAEQPTQWYVMEISSFQLDDIQTFRPDIAILLNITPDHLDRYNYQFENYVTSKFNITKYQTSSDYFITNQDDPVITNHIQTTTIHSQTIFFTMNEHNLMNDEGGFIEDDNLHIKYDGEDLSMSIHDLSLKGKHNQYNSMAAGISASVAGIRKEKIRETFSSFNGLEHRLEFVATVRGVDFINDSKATNVNSVWYALETMTKPTVLILGGIDKGNDYSEIMHLVKSRVKAIVCMGLDNTPIHKAFEGVVETIVDTSSANEAVKASYALAEKEDVVLLAPACASFDLFRNYEERGRQFKEAVRSL
jgi:UDP-N-acetylmuramoylalanine--D-glutamate ligase